MNSIIYELLGLAIDTLRRETRARAVITVLSLVLIGVLIALFVFSPYFVQGVEITIREFAPPAIFVISGFLVVTLLSYTKIDVTRNGLDIELRNLREERDEIRKRLSESKTEEEKKEENVFDTIQLSLNQITEYYTINKSQARSSFRFSVFAIVAGLVTLIGGVWIFYMKDTPNIDLTIITGISSALIEFIGGAYFYLYNKSLKQLNFFYAKLVRMQDTMLAIKLTESLDGDKEIEMKEKLIMELMARSIEPGNEKG